MKLTGRWIEKNFNASSLTYTFVNGTTMQFKAYDSEGKAKAGGKRDILFLNEANHIPFNIADALMVRSGETYIDYNPDNEFWVHKEVLTQPNSEFLLLTYKDNEGLPASTLEDLMIRKSKAFFNIDLPDDELFKAGNEKSGYWSNWWKVYGMGLVGNLEGVIFNNWQIIPDIPEAAKYVSSGLDFGFTNDPSTIVDKYEINGVPVYDLILYEKGLQNNSIAKAEKNAPTKDGVKRLVYADSSEPKSIKDLKDNGVNATGAVKGSDSVNYGINKILEYELFYVTARSLNLIEELRKYKWLTDKNGVSLNKPIDAFNHCIDPIRYLEGTSKPKVTVARRPRQR